MSRYRIKKYNERPNNCIGPLQYKSILISNSKGNRLREHAHIIEDTGYSLELVCKVALNLPKKQAAQQQHTGQVTVAQASDSSTTEVLLQKMTDVMGQMQKLMDQEAFLLLVHYNCKCANNF